MDPKYSGIVFYRDDCPDSIRPLFAYDLLIALPFHNEYEAGILHGIGFIIFLCNNGGCVSAIAQLP